MTANFGPDLHDLRCFLRVVQEGGFSAAAKALGLPKATVSRRVAQLERQLGAQLLVRTTRSVRTTELGSEYARRAAQALLALDEAQAAIAETEAGLRGRLRVTASVEYGVTALTPVIAEYCRRHPAMEVELDLTGRRADLVFEGWDLAVRVGPLPDSTLQARLIDSLHHALYASPVFLAAAGRLDYVHELERLPALSFTGVSAEPYWTLTDGAQTLRLAIRPRLAVNSHWSLRAAAEAGLGVALMSTAIAAEAEARGALTRLFPSWRSPEIPVHAVYPSQRHLAPKLRTFVDLLIEMRAAT